MFGLGRKDGLDVPGWGNIPRRSTLSDVKGREDGEELFEPGLGGSNTCDINK